MKREEQDREAEKDRQRGYGISWFVLLPFLSLIFSNSLRSIFQVEMTPVGTLIPPKASNKEKRLLEAKYKIFLESIDIQKRWRKEMEDAAKEIDPK